MNDQPSGRSRQDSNPIRPLFAKKASVGTIASGKKEREYHSHQDRNQTDGQHRIQYRPRLRLSI